MAPFVTTLEDRYGLEEPIGAGNLGVVFRGRHLKLAGESLFAIKVLHRELANDRIAMKRFLDEASVGSRVRHPNTADFSDMGSPSDHPPYIAMNLVPGQTLQQLLRTKGPLPLRRIGAIGAQICAALGAAHDLKMGHGGLAASKVMVSTDGTDHVTVLGFRLKRGDPGADQLALGALLYELASGRRPIHSQRPALPTRVTAPLAAVIHRMLALEPEQYASVIGAAEALRDAVRDVPE